ncbi:transcriptional regulatory protein yciT [Vibrio sp. JCM 19236]|nr:transcriptional regulatory protein yciT [Vibrio sp. JCM 19236]
MNSRQNEIVQIVNDRKRVQVTELSEIIGVSGVTIRQDLNFLEQQGYLKRVHGAATALQNDDIDHRLEVRFDIKQTLANKAADLVEPNETVLIEGGVPTRYWLAPLPSAVTLPSLRLRLT